MNTTDTNAVTSYFSERCQPYRVLMACGHEERRMMRPATAGMAWSPDAIVTAGAACAACRARPRGVAATLQAQIGAPAFAMLGARDLVDLGDGLQFKIGRGPWGVTHVQITLAADDTYTIAFTRVRGLSIKVLAEDCGVHADSLRPVIESRTGLVMSLGTMGGA